MYKIPPSYYIKKTLKSDNVGDLVSAITAYWQMTILQASFLAEGYAQGVLKLCENNIKLFLPGATK